jgi:hypothetical protein
MPSHLSEGARRLISKMLVTNSEERATIPQIFDDAWFKVDLPEYLKPPGTAQLSKPRSRDQLTKEIDEAAVSKVADVPPQPTV